MTRQLLLAALMLVPLAACGGGGSSGGYSPPGPGPTQPPVTGVLSTATLKGAPGFVDASGRTVYTFDADMIANQSTCGLGCSGVWPPVHVAAGATLPAPWTSLARGDGTTQLAYKGKPLYTYSGDGAAGQTNGDGINSFGNFWHIARP